MTVSWVEKQTALKQQQQQNSGNDIYPCIYNWSLPLYSLHTKSCAGKTQTCFNMGIYSVYSFVHTIGAVAEKHGIHV